MLLAAAGAGVGWLHKGDWGVSPWIASNYLATCRLEMLKRSFVGTIFTACVPHPTLHAIDLAGSCVTLLAVLAVSIHLASVAARWSARPRPDEWLRWLPLLACPALFWQLGYDLGRLDQLNLALFVLSISLARSRRSLARAALIPVTIVAIWNHESYLVLHLPVICAILLIEPARSVRAHIVPSIATGSAGLLAFAVVAIWGSAEAATRATLIDALVRIGLPAPEASAATTVWSYSFGDTVRQTLGNFATLRGLVHGLIFAGFTSLVIAAWFRVLGRIRFSANAHDRSQQFDRFERWLPWIVRTAPLCGLVLGLVGLDMGRWCAWTIANLIFLTLYLLDREDADGRHAALRVIPRPLRWSGILGPLGVTSAFPLLIAIVRLVL
ncbi:MAG: hypothetical protein R3E12_18175 [Candidatus Eisenbacteria bacterium]|uniref:Uncharacterized protein n=1 Tax=Eiseniibacteriota bacterium TaxID=2212470 RepID=A0A956M3R8_UNCEI|nr:hypothetical protein [Candidatus Eisenbacteria bacterium]